MTRAKYLPADRLLGVLTTVVITAAGGEMPPITPLVETSFTSSVPSSLVIPQPEEPSDPIPPHSPDREQENTRRRRADMDTADSERPPVVHFGAGPPDLGNSTALSASSGRRQRVGPPANRSVQEERSQPQSWQHTPPVESIKAAFDLMQKLSNHLSQNDRHETLAGYLRHSIGRPDAPSLLSGLFVEPALGDVVTSELTKMAEDSKSDEISNLLRSGLDPLTPGGIEGLGAADKVASAEPIGSIPKALTLG